MTRLVLKGILFCTVLFSTCYAFASLEVVGDYNFATVSPGDLGSLNKSNVSPTFPSYSSNTGFGVDARYVFPVYKLLVGGRYESWSMSQSLGGITQTVPTSRGAVLIGYRLIDTMIFLGVIGSYGVSNSMKVTTTGFTDLVPASTQSYSVGAEGGFKMSHFMVGLELGYLSFVGTDLQFNGVSAPVNGGKSKLDLSGGYVKAEIGFSL